MLKSLLELIIETVVGKIIFFVVSVLLIIWSFGLDEGRKDELQKQEVKQNEASFVSEEERKRRDKEYDNLLKNPSIESIDAFNNDFPDDKRIGKLNEIRGEIVRSQRENSIWNYINKTERPNLDSLFILSELAKEPENIKKVRSLLMNRYYEETINKVELYKIRKFEEDFPSEIDKIKNMYIALEKLYYQKYNLTKTHWSCLDYFESIPDSLQRRRSEVLENLKIIDSQILDLSSLENKTFMTDPISIIKVKSPMIFKFGKVKNKNIELSIILDDKYFDNIKAECQGSNLIIQMLENGVYHDFTTIKRYSRENMEFLESNYNTKNGFFKLNYKNYE